MREGCHIKTQAQLGDIGYQRRSIWSYVKKKKGSESAMTTLILGFSLLSAACLSLAVPEFYRPGLPVQSAPSVYFLVPVGQYGGQQLTPYRFPSLLRPYQPAFHPYPYQHPYQHPFQHPYPLPHAHAHPHAMAVQPPIIVLERVPSAASTAEPPATGAPSVGG
ncbi:uncharacterized protein LOC122345880 isoform X2 [Puntigrus tetrazona]|uniref:uncharacterized protein LOC122345880 isoform X2 n=1 Tax=Puntigrus tetrazona TaxID=1606681 RepID=UPI001C88E99B|nr:uncharacterized protein LOC122345880 isoform X2 [Puntigrus tetrazona]